MRRFVVLALLYTAQGLPLGFFSHAVPVLINRTHPAELAGLSTFLAIPWALKFAFAPTVDGIASRRRVILPMNVACVVSLVALGLARPSPNHLMPLLVGFFVVSVFSAVQDVATDALALDLLSPEERGTGGSVQVGAQRAGIIGGGGGILAIIDTIGYREAFFLMAFMLALLTLPVLGLREPARAPRPRTPHTSIARSSAELIRSFLERPDARSVLRLLFLFKVGDALAAGMVSRWYVKQGLSNAQIALTRGTAGGVAAIAGAAAGGLALRAFGARRALFATASLQTCAIAMYLVADIFHPSGAGTMKMAVYTGLSIVEHALGGAATAALFAWMMDHCREESRATDYTVQACLLVVVTGIGIFTSGFIVGAIGLRGLFATATLLGLLAPIAVVSYARSDGARVGAGL